MDKIFKFDQSLTLKKFRKKLINISKNFNIILKNDEKYDSDFESESQSAANISKKIKISSSSVARKLG
jgi:hypothetical protein